MRPHTIVLAALAALAAGLAAAAHAWSGALNPVKLALQHSDLPSNVEGTILGPAHPTPMSQYSLRVLGPGLKGADYSYTWPAGGTVDVPGLGATAKEWHLSGEVFVAPG